MEPHGICGSYFTLRPDLGFRHIKPNLPRPATINVYEDSLGDVIRRILISVKRNENGKIITVYPKEEETEEEKTTNDEKKIETQKTE